jgi:hypothetical protein
MLNESPPVKFVSHSSPGIILESFPSGSKEVHTRLVCFVLGHCECDLEGEATHCKPALRVASLLVAQGRVPPGRSCSASRKSVIPRTDENVGMLENAFRELQCSRHRMQLLASW